MFAVVILAYVNGIYIIGSLKLDMVFAWSTVKTGSSGPHGWRFNKKNNRSNAMIESTYQYWQLYNVY